MYKRQAYGGELFHGVVPRVLDVEDYKTLTLEDLANGICQVDTANWAEPWEVLKSRILEGFEAIAKEVEENGGGNALVLSLIHILATTALKMLIRKNYYTYKEHPSGCFFYT